MNSTKQNGHTAVCPEWNRSSIACAAAMLLLGYLVLRLQGWLPLNPPPRPIRRPRRW